jgi:hypothetical protein
LFKGLGVVGDDSIIVVKMLRGRWNVGVTMNKGFNVVEGHVGKDIERDEIGGEGDIRGDDGY